MNSDRNHWIGLAALVVGGLGFLWPTYATRMWNAGHYQFFVAVFAAVAWLLWDRRREILQSDGAPDRRVVTGLWVMLAGLIAAANIGYSGFLGIVATILAISIGLYSGYDWRGFWNASSVLWLLVFSIPLPLMLDQSLIMKMQMIASELASRLLDGSGIIHFRSGVIIETPTAKFMTEEACSGIRSLFSSLATVSIYGVAMRHRSWRIAVNLAQTVVWVLIGNSIRVAIVVTYAETYPWIATGSGHELLGVVVFGFILAMVASTDVALSRLISDHLVIDAARETPDVDPSSPLAWPLFPLGRIGRMVVVIAFAISIAIAIRTAWVRHTTIIDVAPVTFAPIAEPREDDFDGQFAGFSKASFQHLKRGENAIWAQNSYVYSFTREQLKPILSIDRPWNHWHNLHYCYSNLGWTSAPTYAITSAKSEPMAATSGHKHSELILSRSRRYGFVIYSAIDSSGRHVAETAATDAAGIIAASRMGPEQILAALGLGGNQSQQVATMALPVSTIQVYAESPMQWKDEDLELLRELFFSLREEIVLATRREL